jgi:hypothetical protein
MTVDHNLIEYFVVPQTLSPGESFPHSLVHYIITPQSQEPKCGRDFHTTSGPRLSSAKQSLTLDMLLESVAFWFLSSYGNACQIHAVSVSRKLLSGIPPETLPPNQCDRCCTCRQPIRGVVYPRVLNRQRREARQLLFVVDNVRVVVLHVSNHASKNDTLS